MMEHMIKNELKKNIKYYIKINNYEVRKRGYNERKWCSYVLYK